MDQPLQRSGFVVTCDASGTPLDVVGKLEAHRERLRHLAVSVFLFTGHSRLLLQQRAASKYHSRGLWSNSACTHPGPDEAPADAASRAVFEELGASVSLWPAFVTQYDLDVGSAMHEKEYNQVFVGRCEPEACRLNPDEVQALRTLTLSDIRADMIVNPGLYTSWLRFMIDEHFADLTDAMRLVVGHQG
jgi:isopentenyl-diphosphate delta-isomerase